MTAVLDIEQLYWPFETAFLTVFFADSVNSSADYAERLWSYMQAYMDGDSDPRRLGITDDDKALCEALNNYLKRINPDLALSSTLRPIVWIKLAFGFWLHVGHRSECFLKSYQAWRNSNHPLANLAMVVPHNVFNHIAANGFDKDNIPQRENCFALDTFLLCDIDKKMLFKKHWKIYYATGDDKKKKNVTGARSFKDSVGARNYDAMEALIDTASQNRLIRKISRKKDAVTGKYRFQGQRIDFYNVLNQHYSENIPCSKAVAVKIISHFVKCRLP